MFSLEILDSFIEFRTYNHDNREAVFTYIQMVYNRQSPLLTNHPELQDRKKAARTLDIDYDNDSILELIDIYLCRIQSSNAFNMLISYQEAFWEANNKLRRKISDGLDEDKVLKAVETKSKLIDYVENLSAKIAVLTNNIFQEDNQLIKRSEKKRRLTPEYMAK